MQLSNFTVRTSDRRVFRRCLRKWGLYSSMKENLQRKGSEQNINFWFGSGIHFAMEDFHGYNRFGDPRRAFKAYYDCFKEEDRPDGAAEHYDLGIAMLTYYIEWYNKHNRQYDFQTLWLNDDREQVNPGSVGSHPAVEQTFNLDLGVRVIVNAQTEQIICEYNEESAKKLTEVAFLGIADEGPKHYYYNMGAESADVIIVPIYYHGTMDRIVTDKYGHWWILDYKTAKGADTNKLDTDDQISAYIWAAAQWFNHPIYGFIYLQLTKSAARRPKRLKNGEISVDKKQKTTYSLVRQAIIDDYGSVQQAPNKYIELLNTMAEKETPEGDKFIRWDFVHRSDAQVISTYNNIMGELKSMINPNLYLYPNPTRDCIWDCPLRGICIAMDDNRMADVKNEIDMNFEKRPRKENGQVDEWREKIKWPEEKLSLGTEEEFNVDWAKELNVIIPEDIFGFNEDCD